MSKRNRQPVPVIEGPTRPPRDAVVRAAGFVIHARPAGGPPTWAKRWAGADGQLREKVFTQAEVWKVLGWQGETDGRLE